MIQGLFETGGMPALERLVQFTEARHQLLTHNIANLSTPYFKPTDVDPRSFQQTLGEALDRRRAGARPFGGPLELNDTRDMSFRPGRIDFRAEPSRDNILFHDQNDRDVERLMQRLAENTMAHNAAVEMMRNHFALLEIAIRERV
jgi:flagellar basal-body rod protein FlgB